MSFVIGLLLGVNLVVWTPIVVDVLRHRQGHYVGRRLRGYGRNGSW
jgi:hypothetical protein